MFYNFHLFGRSRSDPKERYAPAQSLAAMLRPGESGATTRILHNMSGPDETANSKRRNRPTIQVEYLSDQPGFYLAPRELEVLRWAARGKTTWETAQLLELSEATVAFYARRACSRIGVKSKIHAVAICISAGIFKV